MWPKMLIELLPHLSRLVPLWDKFLNSKAASDKAIELSLNHLSETVRNDLGQIRNDLDQVASAHAGLYRQLQDQNTQIAALVEEVKQARRAAERAETAARLVDPAVTIQTQTTRRIFNVITIAIVLMVLSIGLQLTLYLAK